MSPFKSLGAKERKVQHYVHLPHRVDMVLVIVFVPLLILGLAARYLLGGKTVGQSRARPHIGRFNKVRKCKDRE